MKKATFVYQSFHTLFYKIVSLTVVFGTGIITARWLGPEGKGILSVYWAVIAMVVPLAELGIRQSIAYMAGQKIFPEKDIYSSMRGLFLITAFICVGVLWLAFGNLGYIEKYGWPISCVFLALIPLSLYENYNNGILIARREIERMNYLAFFDRFNGLILTIILVVLLKGGVLMAAASSLVSKFINFTLINAWLKEYLFLKPKIDFAIIREMLKKGFVFAFALFIIQLNYKIDILMLQKLADDYSVGIYSVGVSFAELLKEIPAALGTVLFSRSANWRNDALADSIQKITFLSRVVLITMVVLSALLFLTIKYLIPLLYGQRFAPSVNVTVILLPGIIMLSVFLILNLFLAGQGKPHISFFAFSPALLLNIILNFYYIPRFGPIGASISSTISYSLAVILFVFIFIRMYKLKFSEVFILKKSDILELKSRLLKARR